MRVLWPADGARDLNSFLRSLGPANYVICLPHLGAEDSFLDGRSGSSSGPTSGSGRKLTDADLVNLTRQVAAGMTYLAEKGYVHCDLATRNCLVNADLVVKIADFGLSQRLTAGGANYYRADVEKDALPIRWMPLEAILFGRFTPASDIWAFGVLLWEVFSYALQPYYGLTHEQVIAYLKDGNLLTPPSDSCPPAVYALMRACWAAEPAGRPSFRALEASLADLHRSLKKQELELAREEEAAAPAALVLLSPNDSSSMVGGGDGLSVSARSIAESLSTQWRCIFRASAHDFSAEAFHAHCDGVTPTFTLVRGSRGHLSGGFSDVAWSRGDGKGRGRYAPSEAAFLFTLSSSFDQHQTIPARFDVKKMFAIAHHANSGPVFGAGADLSISDRCHLADGGSYSNLPHSYDGENASNETLFGDYNFTVVDYEVFTLAE
ncbi:hypothetical protein TYRP_011778 [Tyrophagus putrescentiae]|nr:hypothetical protein TYRP_011778 [Tyrophagus putrescentiae]